METIDDKKAEEQLSPEMDKTVGIVAYITLISFIISIVLNNDKKGEENSFGAYHLRQSLGIIISSIALFILSLFPNVFYKCLLTLISLV